MMRKNGYDIHMLTRPRSLWLIIELLLLMIGLPALLYATIPTKYLLPVIWAAALYGYTVTRHSLPLALAGWWSREGITRVHWRPILRRFAVSAILLTAATGWYAPELLFGFVREKPAFWLLVMLLYPLLSVVPQEMIFRAFFFSRYARLFPRPWMIVLASGVAFGLAHILFHNWIAPTLCLIGGVMFAQTYQRTGSLLLVVLEHALYGDFLFTLGLGRYFYHGSVTLAMQAAH